MLFQDENKRRGFIGTMLFHLMILLIFILTALTVPLPLPEEEGIMIDLGQMNDGFGKIEPSSDVVEESEPIEENVPEEVIEEVTVEEITPDEEILTQDVEEASSVETIEPEVVVKEIQPVEEPKEEPREVDTRALFPPKNETNTSTGEGKTTGNTDQGSPTGDDAGSHDGQENAKGNKGISFDLAGRSMKTYPDIDIPYLTRQEKVVVDVTVDKKGNVVKAIAGARGSTSTDQNLWKKAEQASLKTKFTPKPDAPEYQRGTITFVFIPM